jgi:hypothetical protein
MHNAMRQDPHVGILVARNRLTAAHAARKHCVDRSRQLIDGWVVGARGDVHATLFIPLTDFRQR